MYTSGVGQSWNTCLRVVPDDIAFVGELKKIGDTGTSLGRYTFNFGDDYTVYPFIYLHVKTRYAFFIMNQRTRVVRKVVIYYVDDPLVSTIENKNAKALYERVFGSGADLATQANVAACLQRLESEAREIEQNNGLPRNAGSIGKEWAALLTLERNAVAARQRFWDGVTNPASFQL